MRIIGRLTVLAALAFGLAVPLTAQEMVDGKSVIRTADPAIWSGDVADGPLRHIATGTEFPDRIGDYRRIGVMAIGDGADVSVRYEAKRAPHDLRVTVFLFKPATLPEHRLRGAINAIGLRSPDAFLWSDGPFNIAAPTQLRLFKGTYKTGIGPNTVMDYLYFAPLGEWTVKVRGTIASPKDIAEETGIDQLVRALPWATLLTANGACSGKACQTSGAAPINSHLFEGMVARLISALRGKPDAAKLSNQAPLFEAREGGATWRISELDEKFASAFEQSYGALSVTGPIFILTREDDGELTLPRFFVGTPTEAEFKAQVQQLSAMPEKSAMLSPSQSAAYHAD